MTKTAAQSIPTKAIETPPQMRHENQRLRDELAATQRDAAGARHELEQQRLMVSQLTAEAAALRDRDRASQQSCNRMDEELRLAARLQHDFLPKRLPSLEPLRFATLYRPANWVSGDLYDVFRLDEHHVGFYVADAVGHGVPAALLTMFMKNALATKEIGENNYRLLGPDETLRRLNLSLVSQNLSHATFATAIYGIINARDLKLTFAKAGHPAPVLLRDGLPPQMLEADGGLLGIFADEQFEPQTVQLQRGDRLMIYTDGVEMAFSAEPDPDVWCRILADEHGPIEAVVDHLRDLAEAQPGSAHPDDDLTIVGMEIDG